MPIDPGYRDHLSIMDTFKGPAQFDSTLGENFGASVGEMFDEYSSFSPLLNNGNYGERDDQVKRMIDDGTIPEDIIKGRQKYNTNGNIPRLENDYSALAEWANENLDMQAQLHTDIELKEMRNEEMEVKRKYREDIFSRATTGGKVVGFGGMILGGSLDPVAAAGGFVVGGAKVGAIAASRALYARGLAARGFVGGVASQAAVEPFIMAWQEETNGEYTIGQSIANLAIAGVFSGALTGTVGLFGHASALRSQAARNKKIALIEENLAFKGVDELVAVARQNHKETTLDLERQLDRAHEESLDIDRIQMRLLHEDQKLEAFLMQAEQGPEELQALTRMFDELEILKDVEGLDLEAKFKHLEESVERLRHVAHVVDKEPELLSEPVKRRSVKRK